MKRIRFQRVPSGLIVLKGPSEVARIAKAKGLDGLPEWQLVYPSGRVERYDYLEEARSSALKI